MSTRLTVLVLAGLSCIALVLYPSVKASPRPLSKSELLALVAGQAVPEDVLGEIRLFGLNFKPDAAYVSYLKNAGADEKILAALSTAKITPPEKPDGSSEAGFLQHLSSAGKFVRAEQLDEAAKELDAAIAENSEKPAAGYVMGEVLIKQKRVADVLAVYSEVFRQDPDFPEVHVRLSYAYLTSGDTEEALRQSKAALLRNPDNPVAHLNAGVSYFQLGKPEAARSEYEAAIRCKPDYELAYADLGSLLDDLRDYDAAIEQYKKALVLKPSDAHARYNMAISYDHKGDVVSAIREYREVKRLDPNMLEARQNLGADLIHQDPTAAITEFRELAALAPDWPVCHLCLANALASLGRNEEAEKEYGVAIRLDPANPAPVNGLGTVKESENDYEAALAEYRKAENIDPTYVWAHTNAARVLLQQKQFNEAASEAKQAEGLDPAGWLNYDLHGRALEGSGDLKAAIAEYKEALNIDPKELQARLDLAQALEKQGDWVEALNNYHQAAVDEPPPKIGAVQEFFDAQHKYKSARERFQQHLADLRASGKSSEAASLKALADERLAAPNLDSAFHNAIQASQQALQEKRFDEAESSAKQAVSVAEKIQPRDGRLPEAVGQLASVYAWRLDYAKAEETFKRQLTLTEELYGAQSPMLSLPLQNLAMVAMVKKDFASSEAYLSRSLDLNQKAYGENSNGTAEALRGLASTYTMRKEFDKSEATLLRVVKIYEVIYGPDDNRMVIPLTSLCSVYDQWGKPEKSAPCHARIVSLGERQFGANSPYLVRDLNAEAHALRQLGRNDEAAAIERRTEAIQASAQVNPN